MKHAPIIAKRWAIATRSPGHDGKGDRTMYWNPLRASTSPQFYDTRADARRFCAEQNIGWAPHGWRFYPVRVRVTIEELGQ